MKSLVEILIEITIDTFYGFVYFIKNNLVNFANMLSLILPYAMYFIGQYAVLDRGYFSVGLEICIPLLIIIVGYYLRSTANKYGKGVTVPIPDRRFTSVDEDGEVSIENNRVQELILYIADLEDWLEKKGYL